MSRSQQWTNALNEDDLEILDEVLTHWEVLCRDEIAQRQDSSLSAHARYIERIRIKLSNPLVTGRKIPNHVLNNPRFHVNMRYHFTYTITLEDEEKVALDAMLAHYQMHLRNKWAAAGTKVDPIVNMDNFIDFIRQRWRAQPPTIA
jgi:hypothetical protein